MRQLALRFGIAVAVLLSIGVGAVAQQNPADAQAVKTAEQVFKNIQVFQGKPANQLRPTMSFIASSLGVRCSFCHTQPFSSDAKPTKKRARQMIEMVYAINKSTFGGREEVNCYTCHQGSPHPNGRLSLAGEKSPAVPERPANGAKLPSAASLIARYQAAIGGAAALAAIHSETITAQRTMFGHTAPEALTRAAGKLLVREDGAKSQSGYDGNQFWSASARGADLDPTSDTIAQLRAQLPLYPGAGLKAEGARVLGTEPVEGKPAYIVAVRTPEGRASYAFDTASGLLVRYTTGAPTFLGTLPLAVTYSDYRSVGAVKLPFTVAFSSHEFTWTRKLSAVQLNPSVDAARFQPPAAASAAGGAQ